MADLHCKIGELYVLHQPDWVKKAWLKAYQTVKSQEPRNIEVPSSDSEDGREMIGWWAYTVERLDNYNSPFSIEIEDTKYDGCWVTERSITSGLRPLVKGLKMWNSKPKKTTCNCRRKSRNNPKVGAGCCYNNLGLRDVVIERIDGKRKAKAWLEAVVAGVEPDDVEL